MTCMRGYWLVDLHNLLWFGAFCLSRIKMVYIGKGDFFVLLTVLHRWVLEFLLWLCCRYYEQRQYSFNFTYLKCPRSSNSFRLALVLRRHKPRHHRILSIKLKSINILKKARFVTPFICGEVHILHPKLNIVPCLTLINISLNPRNTHHQTTLDYP